MLIKVESLLDLHNNSQMVDGIDRWLTKCLVKFFIKSNGKTKENLGNFMKSKGTKQWGEAPGTNNKREPLPPWG